MRCAELVAVREAGLGYGICFGAGVAGARRDAATETQVGPAPGVLASVPEPAEARHRGMEHTEEIWGNIPQPLGPQCPWSSAYGPANAAILHCAQIHKGYLDDPRNTDNAWVETVAVSIHFDSQNDVQMKRLNSVRTSCLHGSLTWLSAGMGQVRPQARQTSL